MSKEKTVERDGRKKSIATSPFEDDDCEDEGIDQRFFVYHHMASSWILLARAAEMREFVEQRQKGQNECREYFAFREDLMSWRLATDRGCTEAPSHTHDSCQADQRSHTWIHLRCL